jgi:hypothetical protein
MLVATIFLPSVFGVLVPVVEFSFHGRCSWWWEVLAELEVGGLTLIRTRDHVIVPREAFAIEHAFVVPGAEGEGGEGAEDIAEDVVGVERPAVLEVKRVR